MKTHALALIFALLPSFVLASSGDSELPDQLVLRGRDSFSLRELSIELKRGVVRLATCASIDRHGSCDGEWRVGDRSLSAQERADLLSLAAQADLFGGRSAGAAMDFAYRSLEAHSSNFFVNTLVTTMNDSFSEPGARRDLLKKLLQLEKELEPTLSPEGAQSK